MTDEIDWSNTTPEMAEFIASQGEKFLQAQLQVGIASDQRAMTMAGVFSAVATAMIAGALTYWDKTGSGPILAAGLVGGAVMLVGVGLCLWSARQIEFGYPGNEPQNWYAVRNDDIVSAIGGEAENYQGHITANRGRLSKNGRELAIGACLCVAAPAVAVLAWLIAVSL